MEADQAFRGVVVPTRKLLGLLPMRHFCNRAATSALAAGFALVMAAAPVIARQLGDASSMRARFQAAPEVKRLKVVETADGGSQVNAELNGRMFALRIPPNWNKQAVLFAHGYTPPRTGKADTVSADPVVDDPAHGLLGTAYAQGYAVGHTAYDKLGFAVASGIVRNVALERLLRKIGAKKVFLTGGSMGGSITALASQLHPKEFDGAMAMCGPVSDWTYTLQHVAEVRNLYNYFSRRTPYELPGSKDVTTGINGVNPVAFFLNLRKLQNDAVSDPKGPAAQIIARTMSAAPSMRNKADFATLSSGLILAIASIDDARQVVGGLPIGNRDVVYQSSLLSDAENAALNEGVQRYEADPAPRAKLIRDYSTTGNQHMKLLTVHNAYDPLVAYEHEDRLRSRVERAGNLKALAQQTWPTLTLSFTAPAAKTLVPAAETFKGFYGAAHCGFTKEQMSKSFNDLIAWTSDGIKPRESFRKNLDQ